MMPTFLSTTPSITQIPMAIHGHNSHTKTYLVTTELQNTRLSNSTHHSSDVLSVNCKKKTGNALDRGPTIEYEGAMAREEFSNPPRHPSSPCTLTNLLQDGPREPGSVSEPS